jgi:hypothetical protein
MRRLNFLRDEPWDQVNDDLRVRWFGHPFGTNPTDEPVRLLGISTKRFPDVVAYPEQSVAWVATRHPERPVPESADEGIIARFELPPDD